MPPLPSNLDPSSPENPLNPNFMTPEQLQAQKDWAKALYEGSTNDVPEGRSGQFTAVSPLGGLVPMARALAAQHKLKQFGQGQRQLGKEFAGAIEKFPVPGQAPPGAPSGQTPTGAPGPHAAAPPQIKQMIAAAEQKYASQGLPPGFLEPTLGIESSFNPNSYNELSKAAGIAQFIPKTGHDYGLKSGRGPGSAFDPAAAIDAAARFAVDNAKHLARNGIQPTAPNLYLAHQQGAGGAVALLSNPNAPAGSVGGGVTAHAISANGGDPRAPASHFAAHWAAPFQRSGAPQQVAQAQSAPQAPQAGPPVTPGAKLASLQPMSPAGPQAPASALQAPVNAPIQAPAGGGAPAAPGAGAAAPAAAPAPGQQPTQVAGNVGGNRNAPLVTPAMPPGGADPSVAPIRQQVPREALRNLLSLPPGMVPENVRNWAIESYFGQEQPVETTNELGQKVIVGHGGKGPAMTVNPVGSFEEGAGEGVKTQTPARIERGPDGQPIRRIIPDVGGAPAGPAGAQPPTAPPPNIPPLKPPKSDKKSEAAPGPTMTDAGPEPLRAGAKLASLEGAGPALSTPPPAKAGAEAKTAQEGASPVSPRLKALSDFGIQQNVKKEALKEYNKQDIEGEFKDLATVQTAATNSKSQLPLFKAANDIINQKHFTQGPGSDIKLAWTKAKAFFGSKAAQDELAYNQAFEKITAGTVLSEIRTKLEGTGQVRNVELDLLKTAAQSHYNTIAANRAIIDMNIRYQEQLGKLGDVATAYHKGYRWNDNTNSWYKTDERPTKAGLNDVVRTYMAENPVYTDAEAKNYMKIFEQDQKAGAEAGPTGQNTSQADRINKVLQGKQK